MATGDRRASAADTRGTAPACSGSGSLRAVRGGVGVGGHDDRRRPSRPLPEDREIEAEELADPAERVLDLAVHLARGQRDEPRGEVGDQPLELETLSRDDPPGDSPHPSPACRSMIRGLAVPVPGSRAASVPPVRPPGPAGGRARRDVGRASRGAACPARRSRGGGRRPRPRRPGPARSSARPRATGQGVGVTETAQSPVGSARGARGPGGRCRRCPSRRSRSVDAADVAQRVPGARSGS